MYRKLFGIGVLVMTGASFSAQDDKGKENVKVVSTSEIAETIDGKKAKATIVEVTLEPGQAGVPHRHPGPVFGYVLEGEYEWAIDDKPSRVLKVGDTFYEPTGCVHRVSKNPSEKGKTRVLATVLSPHDAKDLVIPGPKKQ